MIGLNEKIDESYGLDTWMFFWDTCQRKTTKAIDGIFKSKIILFFLNLIVHYHTSTAGYNVGIVSLVSLLGSV